MTNFSETHRSAPKLPAIVAHRGASFAYAENTIAAFEGAHELGAIGSELDVRKTADGVLVVHHDAHLNDGRLIRDLASTSLPEFVPTLAEVFAAVSGGFVNVEIKNHAHEPDFDSDQAVAREVVELLGQLDVLDRVLVSSFDFDTVLAVRAANDRLKTGWLFWNDVAHGGVVVADEIERAVANGVTAIHPHDPLVDAEVVDRAHDAGLEVNVWTVDDPERHVELASFGVDSVITNRPDVAKAAFAGLSA